MDIVAHTMEYYKDKVCCDLNLRNYNENDYNEYKRVYEECYFEMRTALELHPVNSCYSSEELIENSSKIFILEIDNKIVGAVTIDGNEIDDLIVAKEYQGQGYGKQLLQFAIAYMQKNNIEPIELGVADWNKVAIKLYLDNGFKITKTEIV